MKRLIYILLIALVLTGCGNQETDKKTNEVMQSELEGNGETPEAGEEVKNTEDNTQSEVPENTQSESTQSAVIKTTMYAKSSVNVRSGAGASNAKVGSLAKGQEVTKVGEENGWSKIEFNGTVGYVSSKYLSAEKVEVGNTANNSNVTKPNNGSSNNTVNNTTPNQNTETSVHEHSWEPIKEEKTVYYAWRTICNVCKLDMTDMTGIDIVYHVSAVCGGSYAAYYKEVDFVTENPRTRVTILGYKCSCGATKEGSGESWIEAR